jgi:hypothetical protein
MRLSRKGIRMSEKVIGDRTFKAGMVLATDAIKLQIRLVKLIGPALETLPDVFAGRADGASPEDQEKANAAAIRAIAGIFDKADPDAVVGLMKDIFAHAMVSPNKGQSYEEVSFDHEFSGPGAKNLFPALVFILREVLGDFFPDALASGNLAKVARH